MSRWHRGWAIAATLLVAAIAFTAVFFASSESSEDLSPPPRSFFGVVPQTALYEDDLDRMGQGNVGMIRLHVAWALLDPTAADDYAWEGIDSVVLGAAERKIEVLPFLFATPPWVAELDGHGDCDPDCAIYAPRSQAALAAWAEFVSAAVKRYGPDGELWGENPDVEPLPIRAWQIWNEQNSPTFYLPKPDVDAYADLLATSEQAIHEHDFDAEVVLGGMFGTPLGGEPPAITAGDYLRELYEAGAATSFDGIAVHPYAGRAVNIEEQVSSMRSEVVAADDDASTWVTEVGWASSGPPNPLTKGAKGQAAELEAAYELLLERRLEWDIETVSWYSWRDTASDSSPCEWCGGSGLFPADSLDEPKPAWESFVSFTDGS